MDSELPFRKVIIDSRNAVMGESENFVVSLPSTLQLPQNTACYVLSVALSYGFYTVKVDLMTNCTSGRGTGAAGPTESHF